LDHERPIHHRKMVEPIDQQFYKYFHTGRYTAVKVLWCLPPLIPEPCGAKLDREYFHAIVTLFTKTLFLQLAQVNLF